MQSTRRFYNKDFLYQKIAFPAFSSFSLAHPTDYRAEIIADYLPDGASSVLDIGCNYGRLLSEIGREFSVKRNLGDVELVGVDLNRDFLSFGRLEDVLITNNDPRLTPILRCCDALSFLQSYGKTFDVILSLNVFHHLVNSEHPENFERLFSQILESLSPKGTLFLQMGTPDKDPWVGFKRPYCQKDIPRFLQSIVPRVRCSSISQLEVFSSDGECRIRDLFKVTMS